MAEESATAQVHVAVPAAQLRADDGTQRAHTRQTGTSQSSTLMYSMYLQGVTKGARKKILSSVEKLRHRIDTLLEIQTLCKLDAPQVLDPHLNSTCCR